MPMRTAGAQFEMSTPLMSYVLVTDHYRTIRRVAQRLAAQTVKDRIEVIVVAPRGQDLELDASVLEGFAALKTVLIDSIWPMSIARAAGVRAATAPVVFIGETHSFPHAGCCAALIDAQSEPYIGRFTRARIDSMLTMAPPPFAARIGAKARHMESGPK